MQRIRHTFYVIQVCRGHQKTNGYLADHCDGNQFNKKHASTSSKCTTALRLFKTREVFKASQKTLDGITEDLTIFVRAVVSSLEFEIRHNMNFSL